VQILKTNRTELKLHMMRGNAWYLPTLCLHSLGLNVVNLSMLVLMPITCSETVSTYALFLHKKHQKGLVTNSSSQWLLVEDYCYHGSVEPPASQEPKRSESQGPHEVTMEVKF
jgi:hypothetical protein